MSKVSIITPAYNAAKYLEETVKSVQSQTYTDWEMIIVDDCSTDNTLVLATKLAGEDNRIKVLQKTVNSGVALTRNTALEAAKGDYIAFLDADDLWLPDKLKKQVEFMDANNCVLSYTNYQKFDSESGVVKEKILRAPSIMSAKRILGDTSIGCLTVMVNKKISGDFHMPNLKHMEDNITWQQILFVCKQNAYRIDEVLALYREGNSSLTSSKKKAVKQQWNIYRNYYHFSVMKSFFYFTQYAFRAVKKHFF